MKILLLAIGLILFPHSGQTVSQPVPAATPSLAILQSASGDQIAVTPIQDTKHSSPGFWTRLLGWFRPSDRETAPSSIPTVTLCLVNAAQSPSKKAFDIQATHPPRYVAATGQTVCGTVEPARQTLFFWRMGEGFDFLLVLSHELDLTRRAGQRIMLRWIRG